MYALLVIFPFLLGLTTTTPTKYPIGSVPTSQSLANIVFNSTVNPQANVWSLDSQGAETPQFRLSLHQIFLPGNSTNCSVGPRIIISLENEESPIIFCKELENHELIILSKNLTIQVVTPPEFSESTFVNISYRMVTLPLEAPLPICFNLRANSTRLWACRPEFYSNSFSDTQCISIDQICDGVSNCPHEDDEFPDICQSLLRTEPIYPVSADEVLTQRPGVLCPTETFWCSLDAKCLSPLSVCDGHQDCFLSEDESSSACDWKKERTGSQIDDFPSEICSPDTPFLCRSDNSCLPLKMVCDSVTDCSDGFDESAMACRNVAIALKRKDNDSDKDASMDSPSNGTVLVTATTAIITTDHSAVQFSTEPEVYAEPEHGDNVRNSLVFSESEQGFLARTTEIFLVTEATNTNESIRRATTESIVTEATHIDKEDTASSAEVQETEYEAQSTSASHGTSFQVNGKGALQTEMTEKCKTSVPSAKNPPKNPKGEIVFPPLWTARISSDSFFLCYGVLLAGDGPSRWVLIPFPCGRHLKPSSMHVNFGAGIDNYEIIARVDQKEKACNQNGQEFSLLQLNSSDAIKHFIPQGLALRSPQNISVGSCKLLAPRHGYIYSFQLQDVYEKDSRVCSARYSVEVGENFSCFSQNVCLQNGLGGIMTCSDSTLGFYVAGADCYQGQIGWPVLISRVNGDVFDWIRATAGEIQNRCGYAPDKTSFPWYAFLNLLKEPRGLCLAAYVQNDTFPLVTSVRCLRQCLRSIHGDDDGGCVLEGANGIESDAQLCTVKNMTQRLSEGVKPWRHCLVAHLASHDQKVVQFEEVVVTIFDECKGTRFYNRFMAEQSLCISSMSEEATLNCTSWGEAAVVQCQRERDGLWEFIGVTMACVGKLPNRWFMRKMEL